MDANSTQPQETQPRFRWLSGWSRLFLEMLAITFGVLLAFGLNAWWQGKQDQAFNDRSLALIEAEIDRNAKALRQSYAYRLEIYPELLKVIEGQQTRSDFVFRGTRPPQLERAAYQLATSNAVFTSIPPEDAQAIISLYLNFDRIENTHSLYANGLPMMMTSVDGPEDIRATTYMRLAFMDFIYAEGETINVIAKMRGTDGVGEVWQTVAAMHAGEPVDTPKTMNTLE